MLQTWNLYLVRDVDWPDSCVAPCGKRGRVLQRTIICWASNTAKICIAPTGGGEKILPRRAVVAPIAVERPLFGPPWFREDGGVLRLFARIQSCRRSPVPPTGHRFTSQNPTELV